MNIGDTHTKTYGLTIRYHDDLAILPYPSSYYASNHSNVPTVTHRSYAASKSKSDPDTFTWDEVMQLPDKDLWYEAAKLEIADLVDKHSTWSIVPKSEAKSIKPLPTTWVFCLKRRPHLCPW